MVYAQRFGERQAAAMVDCGTLLPACPLDLKVGGDGEMSVQDIPVNSGESLFGRDEPTHETNRQCTPPIRSLPRTAV